MRGFDENILKLVKSATLNTKPWPGKFFSGNSLNFCKQIWSFLCSCCPHFWKHGFEKSKSIKSDLEEKWVDYPWKYFAEFEWDGKLLRHKTGVQIGKQKPMIILTWFLLFFNTGSCFTNEAVIHMDWRQIGFKSVGIWRMLRYKAGHQILTPNLYNIFNPFLVIAWDFGLAILPKFGAMLSAFSWSLFTQIGSYFLSPTRVHILSKVEGISWWFRGKCINKFEAFLP